MNAAAAFVILFEVQWELVKMNDDFAERLQELERLILRDYGKGRVIDRLAPFTQPDPDVIKELTGKLLRVIFPGFFIDRAYRVYNLKNSVSNLIEDIAYHLTEQTQTALKGGEAAQGPSCRAEAERITEAFLRKIPEIRGLADADLTAAFDGDPAAGSREEIIISYPGLYASTVQRLAHVLYEAGVPLIPRMMTELAHNRTGIDIHPGAAIGRNFFIDHGTGIVIGETTVIGDNVKIYQGVTLGALSTRGGQKLHGRKRHPTIEDNVTIYAGASILGGETVIGHDAVIGSNAFITKSVEPGMRVSVRNRELQFSGETRGGANAEPRPVWYYMV